MERVELPPKYKTGHEHIDEQHAHLFNVLFTVISLIKNEKALPIKKVKTEITDLLSELHKYTNNHFQFEEKLMEKSKYPGLEGHRKIHQGFIKKVIGIQKEAVKISDGSFSILNEMSLFLRDWYKEHILIEDNKLVLHINEWEKNNLKI